MAAVATGISIRGLLRPTATARPSGRKLVENAAVPSSRHAARGRWRGLRLGTNARPIRGVKPQTLKTTLACSSRQTMAVGSVTRYSMGAKNSKNEETVEQGAEPPPSPVPKGAVNRRRRCSVSAEVDASKAPRVKKVVPKTDAQLKDIETAISRCFLFSSLCEAQRKEVVDSMEERRYQSGDAVIEEGGPGDFFYVTGSGELEVFIAGKNNDEPLRTLKSGDAFGELALMYNSPRTATVKAVTGCLVWALDRTTFRHTILEAGQQRRQKYEVFLANVEILKRANLSATDIAQLADAVEPIAFADGDTIIKEGDDDRNLFKFYIVEEGEARAYVHEDGEEVLMSHLHPGDHFGEKALVEKTPRTATVKAHGPLKCAALSIAGFERLMGPCEDILTTAYNNPADVKTGRQTPRGGA